jgi:predicted transcriptional regulator
MTHSTPAVTLSIRVLPEIRDKLAELSDATGRTKSFLAAEAIENYLETQAWQVNAIEKAIKKADSKKAKFFDHNKIVSWVNDWDNKNEKEMPK